jgi:hypothetical protein
MWWVAEYSNLAAVPVVSAQSADDFSRSTWSASAPKWLVDVPA